MQKKDIIHTMQQRIQASIGFFKRAGLYVQSSLPNRCLLCQQRIEQDAYQAWFPNSVLTGVCQTCLVSGLYQAESCLGCGKLLQVLQPYCGQCQKAQPMQVVAPCSYHQGLGELVSGIKYRQQCAPLNPLVDQLVKRINDLVLCGFIRLPQVLVPVPLHANRLQQRGFNQAWLIAKAISERLNIPLDDTCLTRVIDTQPQAGLDGVQRRQNCHQAFRLNNNVTYQRIGLIDDVVTTGTTINEISQLFSKQHIHVQTWCLARAEAPGLII